MVSHQNVKARARLTETQLVHPWMSGLTCYTATSRMPKNSLRACYTSTDP